MIQPSTNGLLQGLSNKDIKEVLQKALSASEQKQNPQQASQESVKRDIYQNITTLLKELSTQSKTPKQVLNTLAQPELAKPMQQVSTQLNILVATLKNDKTLSKFAPLIEKLLLNIKQLDSQNIQKGLNQAGVSFEAKLAKPMQISTMPPSLQNTLIKLQSVLSSLDTSANTSLKEQIQTLLTANKVNKDFMAGLEQVLRQSKGLIEQQSALNSKALLNSTAQKELSSLLLKLDTLNKASIPQVAKSDVKEVLFHIQKNLDPLIQAQKNQTTPLQKVENLLNFQKADRAFINEAKVLIEQLRAMPLEKGLNTNALEKVIKLEDLAQKSALLESKITNKNAPSPLDINNIKNSVKQELQNLITDLKNPKSNLFSQFESKEKNAFLQLVQSVSKMPDFFSLQNTQNMTQGTLSEQISRMVNILKSQLSTQNMTSSNTNTLNNIETYLQSTKLSGQLEEVLKNLINTKQLLPEQKLMTQQSVKEVLNGDIKGVLLSLRGELLKSNAPNVKELLAQVDRALAQVEYHQLVSLSSGTYTSYLPLLWDGLKEGSISLKKLKENRFFCEINLTLKDYGKVDLMLMLFEDVHVNISIFANQSFLGKTRENIRLLKQGLNSLGLIPATIQYFDETKDKHKKEETRTFVDNSQVGSGFNLKV